MISILLSAAICAVVAGGGAAAVWVAETHLGLPKKAGRFLQMSFLVLGIGLIRVLPVEAWSLQLTPQSATNAKIDRALQSLPVYGVLKDHYPSDYAVLLSILQEGVRANESELDLIARARPVVMNRFSQQMIKASDASIMSIIDLTVDQAGYLSNRSPRYCHELLNASNHLSFNPSKVFPAELVQRDLEVMAQVLLETAGLPDRSVPPLSDEALAHIAEATFASLNKADAEALDRINFELTQAKSQEEMSASCRFALGMVQRMAELPPKEAAHMFRSFLANPA